MPRHDSYDLVQELVELCKDLQSQIQQQLIYYRASVYKTETVATINIKLKELRTVVELFGCEETSDYFLDFEASRGNGNIRLAPGECLLSWRIADLFCNLEESYDSMTEGLAPPLPPDFAQKIRQYGSKLASMCPEGSRKRSFFETL